MSLAFQGQLGKERAQYMSAFRQGTALMMVSRAPNVSVCRSLNTEQNHSFLAELRLQFQCTP